MLNSDIIAEIITEVGGDTTDSDLTTKMFGFFKAAMRHIPAYIRDRLFTAEGSQVFSTGDQDKAITVTGFAQEREIWYVYDGKRIPIAQARSLDYFHRFYTTIAVAKPLYYRIYGSPLRLQFNCPIDATTTIGFDYFKEIGTITISDSFMGSERLIEAAKHLTKMIYYGDYAEDANMGATHERQGKEIIRVLEEEYEIQEQGGHVEERIWW